MVCLVGQQPMVNSSRTHSNSYRMLSRESTHHSTLDLFCVSQSIHDARRQMHPIMEPKTLTRAESHNLVYAHVPLYRPIGAKTRSQATKIPQSVHFLRCDSHTQSVKAIALMPLDEIVTRSFQTPFPGSIRQHSRNCRSGPKGFPHETPRG